MGFLYERIIENHMTKHCAIPGLVVLATEQRKLPFKGQRVKEEGGGEGKREGTRWERRGEERGGTRRRRGREGRRRKREGSYSLLIKLVGKAFPNHIASCR